MDDKRKCLLNVAHLNVRSLALHFNDVRDCLISNSFDIFGLTETWLDEQTSSSSLAIDGFTFLRLDRGARGGGVGFYVRSTIGYKKLSSVSVSEQLCLILKIGSKRVAICVVYRPHSCNYKLFLDDFEARVGEVIPTVDYLICLGDFNIDFLDRSSVEMRRLLAVLESVGLKQTIKDPTRVTLSTSTLLDYILTTDFEVVENSGVLPVLREVSDHDLPYCVINLKVRRTGPVLRTYRDFKNLDYEQFKCDLMSIPWNNIYDKETIDEKVEFLTSNILILLDLRAPFKTSRISKNYAPWLTETLRLMIGIRNQAFSKFKRSKLPTDWNEYKKFRNLVTAAVKREKKAYYSRRINESISQKTAWANLKSFGFIEDRKIELPFAAEQVDSINAHFLDSVPDLSPLDELLSFYSSQNNVIAANLFSFEEVGEIEILEVILPNPEAPGWAG